MDNEDKIIKWLEDINRKEAEKENEEIERIDRKKWRNERLSPEELKKWQSKYSSPLAVSWMSH